MAVNANNYTFLWGILVVVLLPAALVHGVPINIVDQQSFQLDLLEENFSEEPLPLQRVEEVSTSEVIPISLNKDLPTVAGVLEDISNVLPTSAPIIQFPGDFPSPNVVLPVDVAPLALLPTPEAPVTKLYTRLFEEFVPVYETNDVQLPEAPFNNLDNLVEHQTLVQTISTPIIYKIAKEEPINEIENNQDIVKEPVNEVRQNDEAIVLAVEEKPIFKLGLQYSGYYNMAIPVYTSNLLVEEVDESLVLSSTVLPVSEEPLTTTANTTFKITTSDVVHHEELSEFEKLIKSSSHKKEAVFKIIIKIINRLITEECNFSVEEVNEALIPTDHEKKLVLKEVKEALVRYLLLLETGTIESAKLENVIPTSSSSEEEESKSSVQNKYNSF